MNKEVPKTGKSYHIFVETNYIRNTMAYCSRISS